MPKNWTGGYVDDCGVFYGVSGNEAEHATNNYVGRDWTKRVPEPVPSMAEVHGGTVGLPT